MNAPRRYLDHNATSPLRPEARDALLAACEVGGNASSLHREGRAARAVVETARARVAELVGAEREQVVFTSGGTEANNLVLRPGALRTRDGRPVARLVTCATEHPSVLDGHRFATDRVVVVPVRHDGVINLGRLADALASDEPTLVSVQAANSETGVVQPIADIVRLARKHGAVTHADAAQAAGRLPVDFGSEDAPDALTLSGHKLGGVAGAGALAVDLGLLGPEAALIRGGGQERRLRSGTESLPAIAAFGAAAAACHRDRVDEMARLTILRDRAEGGLRQFHPDVVIFGEGMSRLANTLAFALPGITAETALMVLDLDGVAVSSGSACSSGKVGRSHVLAAMGIPADLAACALRVSFGWSSVEEDVPRLLRSCEKLLQRLYSRQEARAA